MSPAGIEAASERVIGGSPEHGRLRIEFPDNAALPLLYGERDRNLARIERQLDLALVPRGNVLSIAGSPAGIGIAQAALSRLYDEARRGAPLGSSEIDAAVRLARQSSAMEDGQALPSLKTRKRQISARTAMQAAYIKALKEHELVFGVGPAGCGKTYLAVAAAVDQLMTGQVERIVLSRPAVEAGERLGFLPGDLKEKVDPYLRPLYDALGDMMPSEQVAKRLASGDIEVAPLAFMRGRTLARAFVILDEAQNTTAVQMKMFVTRLGEGSRMAITGDLTQIDLPAGVRSGLTDAIETLSGVEEVAIVRFSEADVVRHPLVARIVAAYERRAARRVAAKTAAGRLPEPPPE